MYLYVGWLCSLGLLILVGDGCDDCWLCLFELLMMWDLMLFLLVVGFYFVVLRFLWCLGLATLLIVLLSTNFYFLC